MKSRFNIKINTRKTGSQQNLMAQRMPARVYKDKKKEGEKYSCRNGYGY